MKVLIVRLSAIGDVIQGIPCLVALKESFPDWEISWLVEETSAPLLEGHPYLKKLFVLKRKWRKQERSLTQTASGCSNFFQTWKQIRQEKFDISIDLQGLLKSGLWTFLSAASRRIGHNKTREFAHCFLNEYVSDRPVFDPHFPLIDRYLEPAKYLGADLSKAHYLLPAASSESRDQVDKLLLPCNNALPKIAFCPWSAWETKNWSIDRWIELGKELCSKFQILIIGAQSDGAVAKNLERQIPGSINLTGRTSLPVLAEIFRRCTIVVGPDSGPVHLANATGVPKILMLFGSTSWQRSGPWGKQHRTISKNLECQPCFERVCPLGHLNCQSFIPVHQVSDTIRELV
jgi:lipopolysaccharide heptosyltransferase I